MTAFEPEPPITGTWIASDLRALGVDAGNAVLLHSSLRSLSGAQSMVLGAEITLLDAVREVLTPAGLLCMPAFSADYSDPAHWSNPPVPEIWWPIIRETWPPFRPGDTPTFHIGCVAETFRNLDGVYRSNHPTSSFAAWGAEAQAFVADHPLTPAFGESSPLGRLYHRDARVLMLGTSYGSCTCFHLAEGRMSQPPKTIEQGSPVLRDGRRQWVRYEDLDYQAADFDKCGNSWEELGSIVVGSVGRAEARLFSLRDAVDFAVGWLETNR